MNKVSAYQESAWRILAVVGGRIVGSGGLPSQVSRKDMVTQCHPASGLRERFLSSTSRRGISSGPRPLAPGSTRIGFHIDQFQPTLLLVLAGRQRFSRYQLTFQLEAVGEERTTSHNFCLTSSMVWIAPDQSAVSTPPKVGLDLKKSVGISRPPK